MRELTLSEMDQVSGGNLFVYGVIGIASSYYTGKAVGTEINNYVNNNFGMTTGEALYYTLN